MPTPEQALVAELKADERTMAILTGGVWPDQGPQQSSNWLAYQVVSDFQQKLMGGGLVGLRQMRFQLTARLDYRIDTSTLKDRLKALFDGFSNTEFGGLMVKASFLNPDEGAVDEDESPRPGESSGFRVVRLDLMWFI